MKKFRNRNIMGETRRQVTERRLYALESHIRDLELRLSQQWADHLREFHPGQQGAEKEPES